MRSLMQNLEDRRFLSAGALDDHFGMMGVASKHYGAKFPDVADVAIERGGRVLALVKPPAGPPGSGGAGVLHHLLRYNRDGSTDSTFAGTHIADGHPRGIDTIERIATLPDGRIMLACTDAQLEGTAVLLRLTPKGKIDRTFGHNGVTRVRGEPASSMTDLAVQRDGKLLLLSRRSVASLESLEGVVVTRLTAEGRLDSAFGDGGTIVSDLGIAPLPGAFSDELDPSHVMADGAGRVLISGHRIVKDAVANTLQIEPFLARLTPAGALDTAFDQGASEALKGIVPGQAFPNLDDAVVTPQDDGVAVIISSGDLQSQQLVKLRSDGRLDTGFSGDGVLQPSPAIFNDGLWLAAQPDGGVLVAGDDFHEPDSRLMRFNPDGTPDAGFGSLGTVAGTNAGGRLLLGDDGSITQVGLLSNESLSDNTLQITRRYGEEGPAGLLFANHLWSPPTSVYKFEVEWRDDDGVDATTLADALRVIWPDGAGHKARLVAVSTVTLPGQTPLHVAHYKTAAPGGVWDAADDGTYTVALRGGKARDVNGVASLGRTLGSFVVRIK